jgi:2-oxoglutarate ferredoxin oxidoreductase subunit alpha
MSAQALDLAERLQTPVFVMTDLDIGMNQRLCRPFAWDDSRQYDRGKVMTARRSTPARTSAATSTSTATAFPTAPIPARTRPRAAISPAARRKNAYAGTPSRRRLRLQHAAAAAQVRDRQVAGAAAGALRPPSTRHAFAAIFYGSTSPAMHEALDALAEQGIYINALRVRAFPFQNEIADFIAAHSKVFVVEQNFDAQLTHAAGQRRPRRPGQPDPVLHYDGTPITARFITQEIAERVARLNVRPLVKHGGLR